VCEGISLSNPSNVDCWRFSQLGANKLIFEGFAHPHGDLIGPGCKELGQWKSMVGVCFIEVRLVVRFVGNSGPPSWVCLRYCLLGVKPLSALLLSGFA